MRFVSEPITPVADSLGIRGSAPGEPAIPGRFIWRSKEYAIGEVLGSWRELGPCKSGGKERYVRKHWFHIRTADGLEMKLYFERQPRSKSQSRERWWLFSLR
jgi:hypothetical protein